MEHVDFYQNKWDEEDGKLKYILRLPLSSPVLDKSFNFLSGDEKIIGQFSYVRQLDKDTYEAIRDPLGINKLFYTSDSSGNIHFSEHFSKLFSFKTKIYSVPAGKYVQIKSNGERKIIKDFKIDYESLEKESVNYSDYAGDNPQIVKFKEVFNKRLSSVFATIKCLEEKGYKIFIALSGGLDSSIIANAASKYLSQPIACTLNLGNSEDAEKSALISKAIGIRHVVFDADREELLKFVNIAPSLCQDFRDFNVHCAVLNLILAKNIRSWVDANYNDNLDKVIVLTGDLMNEYLCDYAEEVIENKSYYRLPRVSQKELQKYLIRGIDTSDRELTPFAKYQINCIQPYAALFDLYLKIGGDTLAIPDIKKKVNKFFVPDEVNTFLPKEKLRAQVGSRENMGILGLCHQEQIGDTFFKESLLSHGNGDPDQVPIFVGKYDTEEFV